MTTSSDRNYWLDNLRSFITVLVVAHHASLAYTTFAYFNKDAYILSTHPIVDTVRWKGLDIFEDFNDIFFMSLMFLISGIFVMQSLQKKGAGKFITGRFSRLFIPFAIGVTLLMLLAYYPAWYLAHGNSNLKAYVIDFFIVEAWPVGPPWFIWVLFAFNVIIALCYPFAKKGINKLAGLLALQNQYPARLFFIWYIITWMVYVPVVLFWVEPGSWTGWGPFDFQKSRVLLYFTYFLLGVLIGAKGLQNGIFSSGSAFIKKWQIWVIGCLGIYVLLKLSEAPLLRMLSRHELTTFQATAIYRSVWTLSCTLSSIAFLAIFKNLFQRFRWTSLSNNAYGIYLVHYIFVVWCQYYLLNYNLPAVFKFLIVFIVALLISWACVYVIRKNAFIKKYL
jgi:glucan biosynthesis protein C